MSNSSTSYQPRHILVTGGAGFIGSNFIRARLQADDDVHITNLDILSYSGNRKSLEDLEGRHGEEGDDRYRFVQGDIRDNALINSLLEAGQARPDIDSLVHFAAESHVDRSILGPMAFVKTNVQGTAVLLEATRLSLKNNPRAFRFVHVSTDEVYGSLGVSDAAFTESHPLSPNSPYAASKAASDLLVRAYYQTYDLPAIITRCSNNYGPYQYPEKLIPLMISRAMADKPLPVYGDGMNVRDWIQVSDHCAGIWHVLARGKPGEIYNIGGECEVANLELVHTVLDLLGKPHSLVRLVRDRPGHDRRYAMDISRMRRELGWQPELSLSQGLRDTVSWYRDNHAWWEPLLGESAQVARELYNS